MHPPHPEQRRNGVDLTQEIARLKQEKAALHSALEKIEIPPSSCSGQAATLTGGGPSEAEANASDLDALKERVQSMAREIAWRRLLMEQSRDGMVVLDANGKVFEANRRFAEMLGYTCAELCTLHVWDWDAHYTRAQLEERLRRSNPAGACHRTRHKRRDGTHYDVEICSNGAVLDGQKLIFCVCRDISQQIAVEERLRESRERLQLAIMGADLGMWDWNIVSGAVAFNARWAEMLGYTLDELAPHVNTWEELLHPDDKTDVMQRLQAHLEGHTETYESEHRLLSRAGRWVWVQDRGRVTHRDAQGLPLRAAGTHLDITERKRNEAERRLIERQRHRVRKAESLGRMASSVGHHFNNLLMVVLGQLELALEDLQPDHRIASRLTEARQAAQRSVEISGLMLAYLGQKPVHLQPLNLAQVCHEALSQSQNLAPSILLKKEFPSGGATIDSNAILVRQILAGLLANAREAIGEGPGEIQVSLAPAAAAEIGAAYLFPADWKAQHTHYLRLEVSDSGCGMDLDRLEQIFDPFFSTKFAGRGLGLAVVLGAVRIHGGVIAVESQPGMGTTVRVFFPATAQLLTGSPAPPPASLVRQAPRGGTILLAEDDALVRKLGKSMLERLGYEPLTAEDGREAVAIFLSHSDRIRCVVLDLTMPGLNGLQCLEIMRQSRPDMPAILASGYDELQVMSQAANHRLQAFLPKPYHLPELYAALCKALDTEKPAMESSRGGLDP